MGHIDTLQSKLTRNWQASVVFLLCLLFTMIGFLAYQQAERKNSVDAASEAAREYQRTLQQGMHEYIHLSRDVAGLFSASKDVTTAEFRTYLKRVDAFEAHPGLGLVGYVPRISNREAAEFEANARKINPSFKLYGMHRDPEFVYPLLHLSRRDQSTKQLTGFDFSEIPARWEAMQKARDLGKSIATAKHKHLGNPRVWVATPIYKFGMPVETVFERRSALGGFVFSAFEMDEVVERVMGSEFKKLFDLEIYDGEVTREHLLYDGDKEAHALLPVPAFANGHRQTVNFGNRNWILYFYPKPLYFEQRETHHGFLVLFSGALLSIAIALLVLKWQRHRSMRRSQLEHGQRFQAVFENHPSAVYSLDPQWRFINANAKAIHEFEIGKDELIGSSAEQLIVPENVARTKELFQEVLRGNAVTYDNAIITGKGKRVDLSVALIPVSIDGKISSVLGIAQNITEKRLAEWKLQESRQMLQLVIDNIPQRVFWKNTELFFLGCNKAFCKDAGLEDPREIVGKTDYDFAWTGRAESYRRDDLQTMQSGEAKINYEEPQQRQDGNQNWLRTSKIPLSNGEGRTIGVLGLYEDITERKQLEQKLAKMAHYDDLTGLPNRTFFHDHLDRAVKRSKRSGSLLGLMYFDIDKFKLINDRYGHDVGDAVITLFAKRVKGAVREIDVVGRLGGDEFALILEDLSAKQAAEAAAAKLIKAMRPAFQVGENSLEMSTSIGIAFHEPGMAGDELIRRADQAMYKAKQLGRNRFEIDTMDSQEEGGAAMGSAQGLLVR